MTNSPKSGREAKEKQLGMSRRGLARRITVQALYGWLINETPPKLLMKQFREDNGLGRADAAYFEHLLMGTVAAAPELQALLIPNLDRPLAELDPSENAILLTAAYELNSCPEVPWRVVVNEAVNLAKIFGGVDDSFKFINGVLDKLARELRPAEVEADL